MRDTCQNLRLRAESLTIDQVGVGLVPTPGAAPTPETRSVQGLVLVRVPRYPARLYGVRLSVTAKLKTPSIFKGFSYKDYLARQGVCSLLRHARVELIETDQGGLFLGGALCLQDPRRGDHHPDLPEPYAGLLIGILRELYERFNATGTSHIIVISGFNGSQTYL